MIHNKYYAHIMYVKKSSFFRREHACSTTKRTLNAFFTNDRTVVISSTEFLIKTEPKWLLYVI